MSLDRSSFADWEGDFPNNLVLQLADRLAEVSADFETLRMRAESLADEVDTSDLQQAISVAQEMYRSVQHTDIVFRVVASVFQFRRVVGAAEECHYIAGDTLDQIVEPEALQSAAWHYMTCSKYGGPSCLPAKLNEASVRYQLAGLCCDVSDNLTLASNLIEETRPQLEMGTPEYHFIRSVEACVAVEYAFNGKDVDGNVRRGLDICEELISACYPAEIASQAFLGRARALKLQATYDDAPAENLTEGIEACEGGRAITDASSSPSHYGKFFVMEAAVRITLAQLGIDSISNVQKALEMTRSAQSLPKKSIADDVSNWAAEAVALQMLVKWNADGASPDDLLTSISLAQKVESATPPSHIERGPMALCQVNCHR